MSSSPLPEETTQLSPTDPLVPALHAAFASVAPGNFANRQPLVKAQVQQFKPPQGSFSGYNG